MARAPGLERLRSSCGSVFHFPPAFCMGDKVSNDKNSPLPRSERGAGTWSRDPFTGCDREGAQSHADIRRLASRCGVTSIGKPTEPVPPSAGAGWGCELPCVATFSPPSQPSPVKGEGVPLEFCDAVGLSAAARKRYEPQASGSVFGVAGKGAGTPIDSSFTPRRTAVISATMATAISAGVLLPILSPTGP